MKSSLLTLSLLAMATGAAAQDLCYADYKASRDRPLELQYGVAEVFGDCTVPSAERELEPRLAADDWQLLEVMDTFGSSGLEERRERAGEFFLRY